MKPPAEADIQRHFRVTPPTVHQMVRTLEKNNFISRIPGQPHSIRILLPREDFPGSGVEGHTRGSEAPREPDGYASPASARSLKKWETIIATFMEGRIDELSTIQRSGARGRVFAYLIEEVWRLMGVSYRAEPIFKHRQPDPWYAAFAADNTVKLRMHAFYNPDFLLEDGTWVEATLSENTAYSKLFRHGHQAPRLLVVWLDEDTGHHKTVCEGVSFPNAKVVDVASLYPRVSVREGGEKIIAAFGLLKTLKGILM